MRLRLKSYRTAVNITETSPRERQEETRPVIVVPNCPLTVYTIGDTLGTISDPVRDRSRRNDQKLSLPTLSGRQRHLQDPRQRRILHQLILRTGEKGFGNTVK